MHACLPRRRRRRRGRPAPILGGVRRCEGCGDARRARAGRRLYRGRRPRSGGRDARRPKPRLVPSLVRRGGACAPGASCAWRRSPLDARSRRRTARPGRLRRPARTDRVVAAGGEGRRAHSAAGRKARRHRRLGDRRLSSRVSRPSQHGDAQHSGACGRRGRARHGGRVPHLRARQRDRSRRHLSGCPAAVLGCRTGCGDGARHELDRAGDSRCGRRRARRDQSQPRLQQQGGPRRAGDRQGGQ